MEIFVQIFLALLFLTFFINIIRFFFVIKYKKNNKEKYILLKIKTDPVNEIWPIWAEWLFSAIHASLEKNTFWEWFIKKEKEKVSFEFWIINQKIALFIYCNENQKSTIEGQLYAQYPNIEIEKVEDYSRKWLKIKIQNKNFSKNWKSQRQFREILDTSTAIWAELELASPYIFPIKRYVNLVF